MPKPEKVQSVAELKERIGQASALYFLDFTKVRANDFNALRRRLGEGKVPVQVVKNRLALLALAEAGAKGEFGPMLRGPTSVVFAGEDPVAPARVIRDTARKLDALKVKGAYLDGKVYGADQFAFLAGLPTKSELRAQLVGALEGPIWELVMCLDGLMSEFVWVLDQVKDRRPPADAPAAEAGVPA
jgi:large subunit ribosomal protein L10